MKRKRRVGLSDSFFECGSEREVELFCRVRGCRSFWCEPEIHLVV